MKHRPGTNLTNEDCTIIIHSLGPPCCRTRNIGERPWTGMSNHSFRQIISTKFPITYRLFSSYFVHECKWHGEAIITLNKLRIWKRRWYTIWIYRLGSLRKTKYTSVTTDSLVSATQATNVSATQANYRYKEHSPWCCSSLGLWRRSNIVWKIRRFGISFRSHPQAWWKQEWSFLLSSNWGWDRKHIPKRRIFPTTLYRVITQTATTSVSSWQQP